MNNENKIPFLDFLSDNNNDNLKLKIYTKPTNVYMAKVNALLDTKSPLYQAMYDVRIKFAHLMKN